jgi:hypothetical protein
VTGSYWRILLKKSKISPRQNSRKSELIAEFGWRCLLKHLRRPLVEFAPVEAVPHVPKRQAHQRFLENWSRRRIGLFQQNRRKADAYILQANPSGTPFRTSLRTHAVSNKPTIFAARFGWPGHGIDSSRQAADDRGPAGQLDPIAVRIEDHGYPRHVSKRYRCKPFAHALA